MSLRKKISKFLRRISTSDHVPSKTQKTPPYTGTIQKKPVATAAKKAEETSKAAISNTEENKGIILYGRPSCPYCARVDRVIEELGVEEKITRRLTTYGSEWRTDLRKRTGSTQVPCLFIDGQPMFESLDIIDWMRTNLS